MGCSGSVSEDILVSYAHFFEGLGPETIAFVTLSKEKHTLKDNWLSW